MLVLGILVLGLLFVVTMGLMAATAGWFTDRQQDLPESQRTPPRR